MTNKSIQFSAVADAAATSRAETASQPSAPMAPILGYQAALAQPKPSANAINNSPTAIAAHHRIADGDARSSSKGAAASCAARRSESPKPPRVEGVESPPMSDKLSAARSASPLL
jgi:hypothetical protein